MHSMRSTGKTVNHLKISYEEKMNSNAFEEINLKLSNSFEEKKNRERVRIQYIEKKIDFCIQDRLM